MISRLAMGDCSETNPDRQSQITKLLIPEDLLKRTTHLLAIIALLAVMCAAVLPSVAADDSAATFKSKCVMCHGADATGKTPMGSKLGIRDLTSADVQKQSDAELHGVIAKGRNKMLAFGGKLSDDQIAGLVKYIRTLAKK